MSKPTLLASAPSPEALAKSIAQYWCTTAKFWCLIMLLLTVVDGMLAYAWWP